MAAERLRIPEALPQCSTPALPQAAADTALAPIGFLQTLKPVLPLEMLLL